MVAPVGQLQATRRLQADLRIRDMSETRFFTWKSSRWGPDLVCRRLRACGHTPSRRRDSEPISGSNAEALKPGTVCARWTKQTTVASVGGAPAVESLIWVAQAIERVEMDHVMCARSTYERRGLKL